MVNSLLGLLSGMDIKDVTTLLIAVYGALLSTFTFVQVYRKERISLVVKQEPSFFAYPDGNTSTQNTSLKVVNTGRRPVTVNAPTILLRSGRHLNMTGAHGFANFPTRLEDGEGEALTISDKDIAKALKREKLTGKQVLQPICESKAGRQFKGKKWVFDVGKFP